MSAFPSNVYISEIFALITGDTPHLALYTTNPTAADTGTEVTGGSYARQPITFSQVGSQISNTNVVTFTLPTASITHYGVRDALTAGDLKVYGSISNTLGVVSGDEIVFPVGSIKLVLAGS